jgi:hypothetical protein
LPSSHTVPGGAALPLHRLVAGSQALTTHGPCDAGNGGHTTTVFGLTAHLPLALSQYEVPLQGFLSSQSASCWHAHMLLLPGAHWPLAHRSGAVHGSPSSQGLPSFCACDSQAPVCGLQTWVAQGSSAASHVTTDPGLGAHSHGNLLLSQPKTPLQALPSSNAAQSASAWHWHHDAAPGVHSPDLQID